MYCTCGVSGFQNNVFVQARKQNIHTKYQKVLREKKKIVECQGVQFTKASLNGALIQ